MDIFDSITAIRPDVELEYQRYGERVYVSVDSLLELLSERAIINLKGAFPINNERHIADHYQARFQELAELQKVIKNHEPG